MITENLRIFLWVGLLVLIWIWVQTWQLDYGPGSSPSTDQPPGERMATAEEPVVLPSLPALPESTTAEDPTSSPPSPAPTAAAPVVRVRTDVLDLEISLQGGDISTARLIRYPVHKDEPDVPVQLLNPAADQFFAVQTGLRTAGGRPEANHLARFTSQQASYELAPNQSVLVIPLQWQADGVTVQKTYRLHRGRYAIDLDYRVNNASATPYRAASYIQLERLHQPPERSMFNVETYSFQGPVVYDGSKYIKLDVEDLRSEAFSQVSSAGWLALIQHHFLAAAIPPSGQEWTYATGFGDGRYLVSAIGPVQTIAAGQTGAFSGHLFVGPKLQSQLTEVAEGLELTVDYGKLTLLAQPLFWLLSKVYQFVGNWGLAIIIVTLLIKLVFYKLSETSGRSMARMRKLTPRMKALQERHKDDRQAMSQALMDLYKREKVNPAAGCLPMIVQIPFFIAFYWVLLESVEMRQAPFALWITDLSSKDPFFILPVLMGAAMYFQQKLNPAPPDPVQAKIMQLMPVMFTVFFAFFPAGLVLYWLTNSVLSIAQQWRINKVLGAE